METPSVYTSIISPQSRRLRTIGLVLLVAICAMVAYGYFGLMPSIARSLRETPALTTNAALQSGASEPEKRPMTRALRLRKLRIAVALAYWGVCGLLIVGVVFVAWLDLREISRQYVAERRAMWHQAAAEIDRQDDSS